MIGGVWRQLVLLSAVAALLLSDLVSGQGLIAGRKLLILADDSSGTGQTQSVTSQQWQRVMSILDSLFSATKVYMPDDYRYGVFTFSGRTIIDLNANSYDAVSRAVQDYNFVASDSRSNAGFDLILSQLENYKGPSIPSVVILIPSRSYSYDANALRVWRQSLTMYNSLVFVLGMELDSASASFFRSEIASSSVQKSSNWFLESSYSAPATTNQAIVEDITKAAKEAESPETCVTLNLAIIMDATAAQFQGEIKSYVKEVLTSINNVYSTSGITGIESRVLVSLFSLGDGASMLYDFISFNYNVDGETVDSIDLRRASVANVGDAVGLLHESLQRSGQSYPSRNVDPTVILYVTYREPNTAGLQRALEQYEMLDSRIIAVGVETRGETLTSIASVAAWTRTVASFNDLQSYAFQTRQLICTAGLQACFFAADIAIVIDAGSQTAISNWNSIRELVQDIVRSYFYGYNGVRFAIVLYGASGSVTIPYTLQSSDTNDIPKLRDFITRLGSLQSLGRTNSPRPSEAFRAVREQVFADNSPGNRASVRNLVLWISAQADSSMQTSLSEEATAYNRMELPVAALGIQVSSQGQTIMTTFVTSISDALDMVYYTDMNEIQSETSRVIMIFQSIDEMMCLAYRTVFQPSENGEFGDTGATGPTGLKGFKGSRGAEGDQGQVGRVGSPAPDGRDGLNGQKGDPGPSGSRGARGENGFQGSQCLNGDRGSDGTPGGQGDVGPNGFKGDKGNLGRQGLSGDPGVGPAGSKGVRGDGGSDGLKGFAGSQGEKGDQGDAWNQIAWR
jgi:hypothetical protein